MTNSNVRQGLPGSMELGRPVQVRQRHQIQKQIRRVERAEMMAWGRV